MVEIPLSPLVEGREENPGSCFVSFRHPPGERFPHSLSHTHNVYIKYLQPESYVCEYFASLYLVARVTHPQPGECDVLQGRAASSLVADRPYCGHSEQGRCFNTSAGTNTRSGYDASQHGTSCSTSLRGSHCKYVRNYCPFGAPCTEFKGVASTLQPNRVGSSEQSALAPVGICIFNFLDYWLTPTVLAHYLPRVVGGTAGPAEVSTTGPGQAHVGPDRKHGNRGLYKSPWWDTSQHVACHNSPAISSFRDSIPRWFS